MRIAMTGASGLIGKHLGPSLRDAGHAVYPLRRSAAPGDATWNIETGEIHTPEPVDVLIHLAGRSVATRWTARARREISDSRVAATAKLCTFLASMPADRRPQLLLSASAVGIYGDRGDELLTEDSAPVPPGVSFLADVCRAWEAAAKPAQEAAIRVIHLRLGVVLARDGGVLAKMRTPTKLGLGGPIGKGTQFLPWIAIPDLTRLCMGLLRAPDLRGPINAVAPNPVRQHEFIRTLGRVLHRPSIFPMPAFMVKLAFGRMGKELFLASQRVTSTRIPQAFSCEFPTLESALRAALTSSPQ